MPAAVPSVRNDSRSSEAFRPRGPPWSGLPRTAEFRACVRATIRAITSSGSVLPPATAPATVRPASRGSRSREWRGALPCWIRSGCMPGAGRGDDEDRGLVLAGLHRLCGGVLVRPRPAEIGEHPIAEEFCGVTAMRDDRARDPDGRALQEFACRLGVEPAAISVGPTGSRTMTVVWRRSAIGSAGVPGSGCDGAMRGIGGSCSGALKKRHRCPIETPVSCGSVSVSSSGNPISMSFSASTSCRSSSP